MSNDWFVSFQWSTGTIWTIYKAKTGPSCLSIQKILKVLLLLNGFYVLFVTGSINLTLNFPPLYFQFSGFVSKNKVNSLAE